MHKSKVWLLTIHAENVNIVVAHIMITTLQSHSQQVNRMEVYFVAYPNKFDCLSNHFA